MRSLFATLFTATLLGSCSSVTMPQEHYYRLALPRLDRATTPGEAVLRVEGFELASALSSDRILVAETGVRLRAYEFHRWISPLNRLVQDAITIGLTRSKAFAEVKGPTDGPGETLVLTGRVLDFQQTNVEGAWVARVTLEMRLEDARQGHGVVVHEEFTHSVPMADELPGTAVLALSKGTAAVLSKFLLHCDEAGVFAAVARPGK